MTQWNDPGKSQWGSASSFGPSWSADPPPSTEPALPPIRSANSRHDPEYDVAAMDTERALVPSQDNRRRGVLAPWSASSRSRPLQQALVPVGNGVGIEGLLIIPGSGRAHELHPTIRHRRPRSRAMNIALISLAGLLALVVLYAATPLTAGAALQLNNFAAGANLFKLPPTPTLTPTPTPQPVATGGGGTAPNPGSSAIIAEINSVFGSYAAGAVNVATCESGLNPNAYNSISVVGSHAEGIFQILYPSTWDTTSEASQSPYNANANILAAHEMFVRDGYSWREWVCQP